MYNWQDWVLALTVVVFNVALLFSVRGVDKPSLVTSLLTGGFMIPQAIVFFSLSLWYSFIMACINVGLWMILAFQKAKIVSKR